MIENNKRIYWADYTKAFAIWLMVLCHFGLRSSELVQFIYVFHMPVFFLVSGYFDKGAPFSWNLLKKNFKRIMIPYFFFSVCSFSICWISPYLHPEIYHNGTIAQTFLKAFVGMFLMEDLVRPYAFMPTGALWFLVALFNVRIIFSLLCLCWGKYKWLVLVMALIAFTIVYYEFPFFSMDSAVISLPFYITGYCLNKYNIIERLNRKWEELFLAIICWLYTSIWGVKNGSISLDACALGDSLVLFYINGIIGSLACIFTFRLISFKCRIIQEIGSSTLTILGTHGYINKLITITAVLIMGVPPNSIPVWYIFVSSLFALCFGVFMEKLFVRYCPAVIGKSRKNNENVNNIYSNL